MSVALIGSNATEAWRTALAQALGEPVLTFDQPGAAGSATIAVLAGALNDSVARFGELELLISVQAGVESLLDPELVPSHVQIARAKDPSLREHMVQCVLLHVLSAHRHAIDYRNQQREHQWRQLWQQRAHDRQVGILGVGELGAAAGRALAALGFPVTGWSRTPKEVPGVRCLWGDDTLAQMLSVSDILVCLLPLTTATRGLIDASRLAQLPHGATVVSLGRGGQIDEAALIDALDRGRLGGAILDVFSAEPLPSTHPFWDHERVMVYPHVAADPVPQTGAAAAAHLIRRHRHGQPLEGVVDRRQGY
jgi:glyoxylate/hydroxypyruvate reductase A